MASDSDSSAIAPPGAGQEDRATRLALALCHEIGNLVGAVRLQAHLLDSELSPKELAAASVDIEDLCARSGAWLSLMRPLICDVPHSEEDGVAPVAALSALHRTLAEYGGRGVRLSVACEDRLPEIAVDPDTLQHLLLTLVFGAIEAARPRGRVSVRGLSGRDANEVCLEVEDDGSEELGDFKQEVLRGRALACSLADQILGRRGGRIEVGRSRGGNRVALVVQARGPRSAG